jgi:hypothetical protein
MKGYHRPDGLTPVAKAMLARVWTTFIDYSSRNAIVRRSTPVGPDVVPRKFRLGLGIRHTEFQRASKSVRSGARNNRVPDR